MSFRHSGGAIVHRVHNPIYGSGKRKSLEDKEEDDTNFDPKFNGIRNDINKEYNALSQYAIVPSGPKKKKYENERCEIIRTAGRQAVEVEQALIIQNQDPTARKHYRTNVRSEALFPEKNFVESIPWNHPIIMLVFRGEVAFRRYGIRGSTSSIRMNGVPYTDFQTVITNLKAGERYTVEGVVGAPGGANGAGGSKESEPYGTVTKFGTAQIVHNTSIPYHVGDFLMACFKAYTTEIDGELQNLVQAKGVTDEIRKQRFMIQPIPIRSTSISVNLAFIKAYLQIAIASGDKSPDQMIEYLGELLKDLGLHLFPLFCDYALVHLLILMKRHALIRTSIEGAEANSDNFKLPDDEWFNTTIPKMYELYANQKELLNVYDTDLKRNRVFNLHRDPGSKSTTFDIASKKDQGIPHFFTEKNQQVQTPGTTNKTKKEIYELIDICLIELLTILLHQLQQWQWDNFIGKVTTAANKGDPCNIIVKGL